MIRNLLLGLMVYAAAGLVLSLAAHLLSYAGHQPGGNALFFALHAGIFPLWIPVVYISRRMTQGAPGKDFWRIVTSGCPSWMKYMTYGFFGYAIINFLLFMGSGSNYHGTGPLPIAVWRGFSGHWMVFYSAGLALLTTAYNRGISNLERHCPNGRAISYGAKFCSSCGIRTNGETR